MIATVEVMTRTEAKHTCENAEADEVEAAGIVAGLVHILEVIAGSILRVLTGGR